MTKRELRNMLATSSLTVHQFIVIQYAKKILPMIPHFGDGWLKARFGMCLVAKFHREPIDRSAYGFILPRPGVVPNNV